ncbi:MAG: methyltransferase, TIGR04325 family [Gemmatimonadaceae bacterium]|nr:methyltransferase, TIGR04325 family [Gemmatimonadaceae bacterium]
MSSLPAIFNLPPLRAMRKARFQRRFATPAGGGACRGVFNTFADAARSAPPTAAVGYDSPDAGAMYRDRLDRLFPSDYPAVYWLRRWGTSLQHVVDLGGHVGVSYYAFRVYLEPSTLPAWTVCDVPAVVTAGRALAVQRDAADLSFVERLDECAAASVLFAAGSLQYLEQPLPELLHQLPALPPFVLVNKLPTHATRTFVTLQHIGVGYCPYRITAADALIEQLAPLGYRLLDRWSNPDLTCVVPFEDDTAPISYSGFAFSNL